MWDMDHLACSNVDDNGVFKPVNYKPQTRPFVYMSEERFHECYSGDSFLAMQYRMEFKGPLNLESIIISGTLHPSSFSYTVCSF